MTEMDRHIAYAPLVSALSQRSAELAVREGAAEVGIRHVLQSLFFRPLTPALERHLLRAAAIAEDEASATVTDLHALLAILEDDFLASTVIAEAGDLEVVRSNIRRAVRELPKDQS